MEDTVVKFTGVWSFKEDPKPEKPTRPEQSGSGGSSDLNRNYSVSTPNRITGGTLSVTPASASKGTTVTIAIKPNVGYEVDKFAVTDQSGNRLSLTDKGNGKYTFTMPAGKVNVDATFAKIETTINFRDVKQSDYYYDAVKWAVEKGKIGRAHV